jgi:hypothetical protein
MSTAVRPEAGHLPDLRRFKALHRLILDISTASNLQDVYSASINALLE